MGNDVFASLIDYAYEEACDSLLDSADSFFTESGEDGGGVQ